MFNPKFVLRAVALMVMSLWAQSASALTCPAISGTSTNTGAGVFVNAGEDTCGSTSFVAGPTKFGHTIVAGTKNVIVRFYNNGVLYQPSSRFISCVATRGRLTGRFFSATRMGQKFATGGYSANCTLVYTDGNGKNVRHSIAVATSRDAGTIVGGMSEFSVNNGWFERVAPTVTLTGLAATIGDTPQLITIVFSEPVYGFEPTDLNLVNAQITGYTAVSTRTYEVRLTRIGTGTVSIDLPAGAAADIARNFNLASATLSATVDITAPTVVLSGLAAAVGLPRQTVTVTFSEDVTGFTLADIDAPFMNLSNFTAVSASVYTFDLSNGRSVAVSVQIPAASAADLTGNANTASNTLTASADPTPPSVWITGLPDTIAGPVIFDATINFSEPVTGFEQAEINISGGVVTAFSGSGATYIATVSASGVDDLTMSVSASVAQDAALNGNEASGLFTSENVIAEQTSANIAKFMLTRSNALLSNQPDLAGLLRGGGAPQFSADITNKGGIVAFDSGMDGPVWARLNANWATDIGAESQYVFGAFGGYSMLSENLLIGGMLQFDTLTEVDGAATTSGMGWLIGPYFAAKLPDQPLYFEGSLLYGQTRNTISPIGTFTDAFSTERWLATLGVSGEIERSQLVLLPFLDAKYTSDAQAAYIDGLGNPIAAQTIALAQVSAGLDFELALSAATMLNGGVSGVWSYSSGNAVDPGYEGGRARFELGVNRQVGMAGNLGLSGFYDGLGLEDFESYGVELRFRAEF
ncbi:MAG: Ig-like domain-containing protein [Rhodobacteraceae bacterium]|nr:Ig-like domain-containing protein [Paracoccaceae bacterium]